MTAAPLKGTTDAMALGTLLIFWAGLWALTIPTGDMPLNDDWVYALAVRSILETGQFRLPSPASANVLTQAYWGALFCLPLGFSFAALRLSTFVLAIAGIGGAYGLLRELGARPVLALVGALTLATNPVFLQLSVTFMTDVPFTSLLTLSLWLQMRGVRQRSRSTLALSWLVALGAVLIRQFALVLPLAYAVGMVMRDGPRPRTVVLACSLFAVAMSIQLLYAHWLIETGRTAVLPVPLFSVFSFAAIDPARRMLAQAERAFPTLGLFIAPAVLAILPRIIPRILADDWRLGRSVRIGCICGLAITCLLAIRNELPPAFGNSLELHGLGPFTLRDTYLLQSNITALPWQVRAIWFALGLLGAACGTIALTMTLQVLGKVGHALRRQSQWPIYWQHGVLLVVVISYFGGMVLLGSVAVTYDRYLLPLIVAIIALLVLQTNRLAPHRVWPAVACTMLLAVQASFGVAGTHDYLAWNRARWQATSALLQEGISPHQIDGGYEFNGWLLNNVSYQSRPGKSYWWVDDDEYIVSAGPLPGYHSIIEQPVRHWLGLGPERVVTLQRDTGTTQTK